MKGLVHIVGGGLAGSEAAWQVLRRGHKVRLYEMRPLVTTAAHHTSDLAELVCSNSLKSLQADSAPGLLKTEMKALNSLVIAAAEKNAVPAGQALAVERLGFSATIRDSLMESSDFELVREEIKVLPAGHEIPNGETWIIATGPLTSPNLLTALQRFCGDSRRLNFYDAIAPIIEGESIDYSIAFRASRYEKDGGDYVNVPLSKSEYETFVDAVIAAEKVPLHEFEETRYFEACLPIEVMIERGRETLRFGPMKPVGLIDPRTQQRPWAAVQLRQENAAGTMYSMVGFQTKMKWPEQKRVFSLLPGLEGAEFFRFGSVHRNTYLKSPEVLTSQLAFKSNHRMFLAGQVTGVEGYVESAAIGLLAGRFAAAKLEGRNWIAPPAGTILGALLEYVVKGGMGDFQPMNANMGLLPSLQFQRGRSKMERKQAQAQQARDLMSRYLNDTSSQQETPRQEWQTQA